MAWIRNRALDIETGDPITVGDAIIRGPDGAILDTVAVDAGDGFAEYQANGQPGIITWEFEAAGQKKVVSGGAYGQAGSVMEVEWERVMLLFGDGVMDGLALAAPGGMNVTVGTGNAMNKGVLHPIYTAQTLSIAAAHATLARTDRLVSHLERTGVYAGRVTLVVLTGTPAANPVAPALTQTADIWEVEVGRVNIPATTTSITSGMLDASQRPSAQSAIADGSITQAKLAKPSVGTPELFDGAVTAAKLAANAITGQGLSSGLIASYWISAQNVLGGQYPAISGVVSGGIFGNSAVVSVPAADFDVGTQVLYGCPIFLPRATTISGVAIDVISGGSGVTARLGLYTAKSNGLPDALAADFGTIALAASGPQSKTISPAVSVSAGWYWAAVIFGSTNPVVQGLHSIRDFFGSPGPGDNTAYGWVEAVHSGTGSMPPTYPSVGITSAGPNIWLRTTGS